MKKQSASEDYKAKAIAAFLTFLIGLTIITPICGLLFQCHCDWPWSRFYFDCNYFHSEVSHKCPWCNSDLAGFGSIGLAFILATLVSVFLTPNVLVKTVSSAAIRVMFGLAVFILVAAMSGALASYSQQYPFGIGGLYIEQSLSH